MMQAEDVGFLCFIWCFSNRKTKNNIVGCRKRQKEEISGQKSKKAVEIWRLL